MNERADRIMAALERAFREDAVSVRDDTQEVRVCAGTACRSGGGRALVDAFRDEVSRRGLQTEWRVVETGCHGLCGRGPIVVVEPAGIFYPEATEESVPRIVEATLVAARPADELLYRHPGTGRPLAFAAEIPFFAVQTRLVLSLSGRIDPASIDDYLAREGYRALAGALGQDEPGAVLEAVAVSGLRSRLAGRPALGDQWRLALDGSGDERYVVCTADEGDPGAFADRSLVEGNPHAVVEGMLLAAFAVGARRGVVRVRHDHRLAGERLRRAVHECRDRALLGSDVLGSGMSFDIDVDEGSRALVCNDETALLASLEGRRATPRVRPPHPAREGLWGRPTVSADVVAYATIPWIVRHGAAAYAAAGLHGHGGTHIVSVTGQVRDGGLVEMPSGTTLRRVVVDTCGGPRPGRRLKAVQVGGPLGGCVSAAALDEAIDSVAGASGSLAVLDDSTCMVDLARHLLSISQREGCGTCVPCRLGIKRSLEILERIVAGEGRSGDVELLEELGTYCAEGTLCVLGGNAANPVLDTLRSFGDEYQAHIVEKRCPAGACGALIGAPGAVVQGA